MKKLNTKAQRHKGTESMSLTNSFEPVSSNSCAFVVRFGILMTEGFDD